MRQVFEEGMKDYVLTNRSEKIKQQAAKFNWNTCAAEYIDVYKQLLL